MRLTQILSMLIGAALLAAQTPPKAVIVNFKTANWTREKGAPPETEGVMIRSDSATGATDLEDAIARLARHAAPAGAQP